MKNKLLKKASKIHALKCNKSSSYLQGFASFQQLQIIISMLENLSNDDFSTIEIEIENWRKSKPEVNESEIN